MCGASLVLCQKIDQQRRDARLAPFFANSIIWYISTLSVLNYREQNGSLNFQAVENSDFRSL